MGFGCFFFFSSRRRHTRCSRDWSSDVCSSDLGPMWDAWERGDRKGAVAAVPEKVIDDLIIRGSTDEIRAHVRRYLAAGIDTAFLALSTAEPDPVRKREIVLGAVRALTPSPP